MNALYLSLADLAAIGVLCFAVYYPRHRRRDLLVAFLGVNVGVLAVTTALVNSDATLGLGLGLFGVLSIIRLRSLELGQHEVAYYFAALALGLLGGLGSLDLPLTLLLMACLVAVIAAADSPQLFARDQQQLVLLDGAYTDEATLRAVLGSTVGGEVRKVAVHKVDLVNDTTLVDVRWSSVRPAADPVRSEATLGRTAVDA
ncbi:DUF4956 domain-containing protein [Nocardioides sp. OK12]|uniref:DUF4956 domain-containing protein n=1 Tax=Nocardioides sp. OK12 TaxID=2758661 RepID=UPI0021C355AC|nr:DUF4956 domain-containing protein [Nocardioides sp. OK12]GHJ60250.1 DUF4956 domain-containing protein [Nocardioides sp. OK12]